MRAIVSLVLPLVFTALVVFLIGCGLPSTPASDNGLRYDPSGSDRDCGDFRNWKEPRPFMKPLMDSQRTSTGWTVIETASRVSPYTGHLNGGSQTKAHKLHSPTAFTKQPEGPRENE